MKQEYSAGIVVFHKEGKSVEYLLLHYQAGHWDLPKGHIEGQESKEETAKRETKEETGLDVEIIPGFEEKIEYKFKNNGEKIDKSVFFFVGESKVKDVQTSFEHKGFDWLDLEKATDRLTFNNAKEILRKANHFIRKLN